MCLRFSGVAGWGILAAGVAVSLNGAAWLALRIGERFSVSYWPIPVAGLTAIDRSSLESLMRGDATYLVPSAELGWTIQRGASSRDGTARSNAQGIRGDRSYREEPEPGVVRVSAFGDSFTHCDDAPNAETWEQMLEALSRGTLEAPNFGVGGYGPDQALLRYRTEGRALRSHVAVLGFMSENINRVVNVFRPFYTPRSGTPLSKPRFVLRDGKLTLVPNPFRSLDDYRRLLDDPRALLAEMAPHDWWYSAMPHEGALDFLALVRLLKAGLYQYRRALAPDSILLPDGTYRDGTEALAVTKALFDEFHREALRRGEVPVFLLFPSHRDILRHRKNGKVRYQLVKDHLAARGFLTVDLLEGFAARRGRYDEGGVLSHYNRAENRIVAEHLLERLRELGLSTPEGAAAVLRREGARLGSAGGGPGS